MHVGLDHEGVSAHVQRQTIKANLRLFTPEILDRINQEVVGAGHQLEKEMSRRPDINLLWDALRKLIAILAGLCEELGIAGWRQSAYQLRQFKKLYRQAT